MLLEFPEILKEFPVTAVRMCLAFYTFFSHVKYGILRDSSSSIPFPASSHPSLPIIQYIYPKTSLNPLLPFNKNREKENLKTMKLNKSELHKLDER